MSDVYFEHLLNYRKLKFKLFLACINGDENLIKNLIKTIPDMVNCTVSRISPILKLIDDHVVGFSPLHFAAEYGNLSLCILLVDLKADVNKEHGMGTPLHLAMLHDHEDVFDFLIKHGANVNATVDTENAFHILFMIGSYNEDSVIEMWARKLIDEGCNVNQVCFGSLRPLAIAPEYLVEYLKANGAIY